MIALNLPYWPHQNILRTSIFKISHEQQKINIWLSKNYYWSVPQKIIKYLPTTHFFQRFFFLTFCYFISKIAAILVVILLLIFFPLSLLCLLIIKTKNTVCPDKATLRVVLNSSTPTTPVETNNSHLTIFNPSTTASPPFDSVFFFYIFRFCIFSFIAGILNIPLHIKIAIDWRL